MPGKRQADPYMMTRGGVRVNLYRPDPQSFDPVLIATTLANEHRYVGNYGDYSVAQHAVNVCNIVERLVAHDSSFYPVERLQLQLAALHHDDPEAILGDIPSPVKRELKPLLDPIEEALEAALETRYDIPQGFINHPVVKEADLLAFLAEVRTLAPPEVHAQYEEDVGQSLNYGPGFQPPPSAVIPWGANEALGRYLDAHYELMERINA